MCINLRSAFRFTPCTTVGCIARRLTVSPRSIPSAQCGCLARRSSPLSTPAREIRTAAIFHLENSCRFFIVAFLRARIDFGRRRSKNHKDRKNLWPKSDVRGARPRINLAWEDVTPNILPPQWYITAFYSSLADLPRNLIFIHGRRGLFA